MSEDENPESPVDAGKADAQEGLTLQELLARAAAKQGDPAAKVLTLPRALAGLTPKELKEKVEGGMQGLVAVFLAWMAFSVAGGVASFAIREFVLRRSAGLSGKELWTAQAILAAPYILLAFAAGLVLRSKVVFPRPQVGCLVLAVIYGISRLVRFQWCGEAGAVSDALLARFADAAAVFAATYFGFQLGTGRAKTDAERFRPGPIEP